MVLAADGRQSDPVTRRRGFRAKRRLRYLPVVGVAAWAITAFVLTHHSKSPVYAAIPTPPAPVSISHGQCHGSDGLDYTDGAGQVWVDAHPSGAVALWLPGFNDRPCGSVLIRLDATHARALAAAVRSVKPFTPGVSNCGADEGASVTIFVTYAGKAKAEVVHLGLGGCGGVTAPGRDSRMLPEGGYLALRPAPAPWNKYTGR